jgi:hypothetical protein
LYGVDRVAGYSTTPDGQPEKLAYFTLEVELNTAPVVQANKTITVLEDAADTALTITSPTDADADDLTITVTTVPEPANGVIRRAGGGLVVAVNDVLGSSQLTGLEFDPAANANGSAGTFRYTVTDDRGGSASQTVTLAITPVNDAPVATGHAYTGWRNCKLTVPAPGVLAGDTDVEGDALTAVLDQSPVSGILTLNADGSFTYHPGPGATSASFTYKARDSQGAESEPATVNITLNADMVKPSCQIGNVVTVPGAPPVVYLPVTVTDTSSGIVSVQLTANSSRVKLVDPITGNEVGIGGILTYDPAISSRVLHAVKLFHNQSARVELRVTDCSGNVTVCDPVITELVIPKNGRSVTQVHGGLPDAEHYVTAENRRPGVKQLYIRVNHARPRLLNLKPGAKKSLDVYADVQEGGNNTFTLTAVGVPGGKVLVILGDSSITGGTHTHPAALAVGVNLEFHR